MAEWIDPGDPLPLLGALAVVSGQRPPSGPVARLADVGVQVAVVAEDALRPWLDARCRDDGIGPGLIALLVDAPPRDPEIDVVPRLRLVQLAAVGERGDLDGRLAEQLARAAEDVGGIDHDPEWVVPLRRGSTPMVRVDESLAVVADGVVGTRGSFEEDGRAAHELVLAGGAWTPGPLPTALPGPLWTRVELVPEPVEGVRWFDLRTGVLLRHADGPAPLRSLRFASLARPGTAVLRVRGMVDGDGGPPLVTPDLPDGVTADGGADAGTVWASTSAGDTHVVGVAQTRGGAAPRDRKDRLVGLATGSDAESTRRTAAARLAAVRDVGAGRLLAEQRRAWAACWRDADCHVVGDADLTRAIHLAVHHLVANVATTGEAAVGARGLTGSAYLGHVFWDADVFVLPPLAAVRPEAARAMLSYRLARLPAARAAARDTGHAGAWFPWESAATGRDVTPDRVTEPDGEVVPVLTGRQALHISADVAWAAWTYARWTGDGAWLAGPGRPLVVEPARFWASRIEVDADGSAHLRGVVGPDEYHAPVDDDTYTNVLARWNLRLAASLAGDAPEAECARWIDLADRLVVHHDPTSGRHEPFAGFDELEPLMVSSVARPPVAADLLLGRERVAGAQVLKQPAVLMAHHVLPDEMAPGSLGPDLDFEGPRLAHGSSLSPAILAAQLARAGRPDDAEAWFRLAARLDLDDVTGTTAGGLHLATMGGVWQALVGGFAGVAAGADALRITPQLPQSWTAVTATVRFHGRRVGIEAHHDRVVLTTDGPVPVRVGPGGAVEVVVGRHTRMLEQPTADRRVSS